MTELQRLNRRSEYLYEKLRPWRGMVRSEAIRTGWNKEQDESQAELWRIGYRQIELQSKKKTGFNTQF